VNFGILNLLSRPLIYLLISPSYELLGLSCSIALSKLLSLSSDLSLSVLYAGVIYCDSTVYFKELGDCPRISPESFYTVWFLILSKLFLSSLAGPMFPGLKLWNIYSFLAIDIDLFLSRIPLSF